MLIDDRPQKDLQMLTVLSPPIPEITGQTLVGKEELEKK
jgi:hypothetical protein